jgi:nicotinic acid mononucleotide adenylyltransferase
VAVSCTLTKATVRIYQLLLGMSTGHVHVWFGGRFSPPTADHMNTAIVMVNTLQAKYPRAKIRVYFVPISAKHPKPSIQELCISQPDRFELVRRTVVALNNLGLARTKFFAENYEMNENLALKTIDNIQLLINKYKIYGNDPIYIALEQCSMEKELLANQWYMSRELLSTYKFIIFPSDPAIASNSMKRERLQKKFKVMAARLGVSTIPEIIILPSMGAGVDSKLIREAVRGGDTYRVRRFTIPSVANYIFERNLYKSRSCDHPSENRSRIKYTRKRV